MRDHYGFQIWTDEDRAKMWDQHITIEKHLFESVTTADPKEEFGPNFRVGDDEAVIGYRWGGVLSMRAGFFVVNKKEPQKILRSIMTRIS